MIDKSDKFKGKDTIINYFYHIHKQLTLFVFLMFKSLIW